MNNDNDTIRLTDVLHAVIKHKMMIMLLTVAGLIIGIVVSFVSFALGEISKEYAITSAIAVTSQTQDGLFTTNNVNPNSTDVHLAEDMVDSVIYVLKSDKLLGEAMDSINLVGIPVTNIVSHLNLTQYRGTQIIEIVLYWRSAEEGVRILNAINDVAPGILVETLKIGSVSVVNQPTAKYRVGGSVNASVWLLAALGGLALGVIISVIQMLIYPTLVESGDLEEKMNAVVLGEIPSNHKLYIRRHSPLSEDMERIGLDVREGYASAAHILDNRLGDGPHVLYVTSTAENEGKTMAAANLAVQLSNQEYKVLLLDMDVRNPSLGRIFLDEIPYDETLNAYYKGDADLRMVVKPLTGYLDLIPAILDQKELPIEDALLGLIRDIAKDYDYVIMDTAPVGKFSDTLMLNRIATEAVFVIRYDTLGLREISEAMDKLKKSGIEMAGCLVTDVSKIGKKLKINK